MRIVADKHIPYIEEMFRGTAIVRAVDGHEITPALLRDADALLVRAVTRVDKKLLTGTPICFVGCATIGTDHVDTAYLDANNIAFASAPGSNANSVAEYVIAALLVLASRFGLHVDETTIGVVGVGNIGSRVAEKAAALGMTVLLNDPPRARACGGGQFLSLDDLMQADVITLHVPLTWEGSDATRYLFDGKRIGAMKPGAILVNTARGAVVRTEALKRFLQKRHLRAAVLDVWEHEPGIDLEALRAAAIGTPHIAGYSADGKAAASMMMYEAVCNHFGLAKTWSLTGRLPSPPIPSVRLDPDSAPLHDIVQKLVLQCYPIMKDDANLRRLLADQQAMRQSYFKQLRTKYPLRREFHATTVYVPSRARELSRCLAVLGFTVVEE